jgi:hypothetical protein
MSTQFRQVHTSMQSLSPNHSLERAGSAPRAVPAVLLLACTSVPSITARVAAAQFNR